MNRISNKLYIVAFFILFAISTLILLIAVIGFGIHQRNKGAPRYDISHQVAIYLFPLILVGRWIYRSSPDFNILLPGAAWPTYFFLSILSHAMSRRKTEQAQ